MGSELRCYALHRVDYYNAQKEKSIFNPVSIWRLLTVGQTEQAVPSTYRKLLTSDNKQDALNHFDETAKQCNPQNRPI
jgi:hypothetical protein